MNSAKPSSLLTQNPTQKTYFPKKDPLEVISENLLLDFSNEVSILSLTLRFSPELTGGGRSAGDTLSESELFLPAGSRHVAAAKTHVRQNPVYNPASMISMFNHHQSNLSLSRCDMTTNVMWKRFVGRNNKKQRRINRKMSEETTIAGVSYINLPASPDLNPSEHTWDVERCSPPSPQHQKNEQHVPSDTLCWFFISFITYLYIFCVFLLRHVLNTQWSKHCVFTLVFPSFIIHVTVKLIIH